MGKAFGNRNKIKDIPLGELFQTHYSLTTQLLEREPFDSNKSMLEPCAGKNAIVNVLKKDCKRLSSFDKYYGDNLQDFLEYKGKTDYIITNPPYGKLTDATVMKAKEVCNIKFAMLLRTNYLSGTTRLNQGVFENLKTVYVFSRMPDLKQPLRADGKYKTAMIVYAWLIWKIGYKGQPSIKWIDNQKYVLNKDDK